MSRLRLREAVVSLLPLYVLAHFGHHVLTAVTSPLLPQMRTSFGLSYEESGLMLSAYTLAYGAGHLVVGWLMKRVAPRILITIGITGVALFGLGIGLAPSFALVVLFQFLMGIAGAGYHPAAATLIGASVRADARGQALGIHIIGGSSSFFVTPLLAGLIASMWDWRAAFVLLALPTLALGLAVFLLLGRFAARGGAPQSQSRVEQAAQTEHSSWARIGALVGLSTVGAGLAGSAIAFFPLLATDALGLSEAAAALVVAVANSPGVYIAPLAGWLSDRLGRVPLLVGASLLTAATMALVARVPHGVLFYALVLLVGAYAFTRMPVSESFLLSEVPPRHRSWLLGFYYFASSALSAAINPVVGRVADAHGFRAAFGLLGIAMVVITAAAAAGFGAGRGQRRRGARRGPA